MGCPALKRSLYLLLPLFYRFVWSPKFMSILARINGDCTFYDNIFDWFLFSSNFLNAASIGQLTLVYYTVIVK